MQGAVTSLSISSNGRRVAIGSSNGEVVCRSYNFLEEAKSHTFYEEQRSSVGSLNELKSHSGPVLALSFSKKKEFLLASAGIDGTLCLYNTSSRKRLGSVQLSNWPVVGLAMIGEHLAIGVGMVENGDEEPHAPAGPFSILKAMPKKFGK